MGLLPKVTKIVILCGIGLLSKLALAQVSQPPPVTLAMRMEGIGQTAPNTNPMAGAGANLTYNFYSTYYLSAEFSYDRPYSQFDDYVTNGMNDVAVSIGDKELWRNLYTDSTIGLKLSVIGPTSQASQTASMYVASAQGLTFRQGFGGRFAVNYGVTATEYYFKYATAQETDDKTVYNINFQVENKLSAAYNIMRDLLFEVGGVVTTYNDYNSQTYNIYMLSSGFTYSITKNSTIDFGVKSYLKDPNADETWNGPPVSDQFFDAAGTCYYIGTTIRI